MPRGERPLAEGDGPLLRFAADLRRLRVSAGTPSYRELARRCHFSATTLSDAAGGRRLPGLEITLAFVRACGGDEGEWRARWHDVAAELASSRTPEPVRDDQPAPYLGLAAFGTADAGRFFGRETVVEALLDRLTRQRFVALFGASGEGKSSLLRAGLVPNVRALSFTPGPNPIEECGVRLAALTGHTPGRLRDDLLADPLNLHRLVRQISPDDDLVLVIDQFEEIFTVCTDHEQRSAFIAMLIAAVVAPNSSTRIVLGVRSDFYPHCAQHAALAEALTDAQILLGAMTPDGLRRAITGPATQAGLAVETALLTTLVADAADRGGVLPLVSHALLETWRRRRGNTLTLAGYQAAGGIQGALARSAEAAFTSLTEDQQATARALLLRLTALGEGTEDTKRRISRSELPEIGPVLEVLADARLITLDEGTVEITHEAVFRAWPRLRAWLADDRDGLRIQHRLTEAARIWEELGRDAGALYRTAHLSLTLDWVERTGPSLTDREREFLTASQNSELAERTATRRRRHRRRWLAVGVAALLVLAGAGATVAVWQRQETERVSLLARSRELAALSEVQAGTDPNQSVRTALQAYDTYPTVEARSRALSAAASPPPRQIVHNLYPNATSFTQDGKTFGLLSASAVSMYDTATLRMIRSVPLPASPYSADFVFSPDGQTIAASDRSGRLFLLDLAKPGDPTTLKPDIDHDFALRFSPDGRSLVTAGATTTVWDTATRQKRRDLAVGRMGGNAPAIMSDNHTLVLGGAAGELQIWDITTGERRGSYTIATSANPSRVSRVREVPNSSMVAVSFFDGRVFLWDTNTATLVGTPQPHPTAVLGLAVSQDGAVLASVAGGSQVHLWDISHGAPLGSLTIDEPVPPGLADVDFAPDGTLAVTGVRTTRFFAPGSYPGSSTYDVRALTFTPSGSTVLTLTSSGVIESLGTDLRGISRAQVGSPSSVTGRFSPDRTQLALIGLDAAVVVRDLSSGRDTRLVGADFGDDRWFSLLAFSPDSRRLLASSYVNGNVVWRVDRPADPVRIMSESVPTGAGFKSDDEVALGMYDGEVKVTNFSTWSRTLLRDTTRTGHVSAIAVSPDRRWIAAGNTDHTVTVWEAATSRKQVELRGHSGAVTALEFSPDSQRLATGGNDHVVTVWDVPSGQRWATLTGHTDTVRHLAWRPDSQALVSSSADNTLRLWPLDVDVVVRSLRARIG